MKNALLALEIVGTLFSIAMGAFERYSRLVKQARDENRDLTDAELESLREFRKQAVARWQAG